MLKFEELRNRLAEIGDFNAAAAVLRWDQQTYMPAAGAEARAMQIATLARTAHERLVSDEIGALLEAAELETAGLPYDSFEASLCRVARRRYDKQRRIPTPLVADLSKARSLGDVAWRQARRASDFGVFQPHLETIVDLTIQKAEALGYQDRIYDALLDQYEPDMKATQVEALFDEMKAGLLPLIRAIAEQEARAPIDDSMLFREYDETRQWAFGVEVLKSIGFDFERGRQDLAAHPFTTGFSSGDVRLTTRLNPRQLKAALFASIHEAGHGMYRQGIAPALDRSPLAEGSSLGIHESQSRMWENVIGRSRVFWRNWLPRLQTYFPDQIGTADTEAFYRAINRVQPSPIRVEADEVTYNLHIFVRFELENMLVERRLPIRDLPEAWNAKTEEYLGLRPENDAQGVLQDMHWAGGMIGYFPTYSLGNLLAAQFYNQAVSERPEIVDDLAAGRYESLLGWLRARIHCHGATYTPGELVQRITGGPMRTEPFLSYVRQKYTEIYQL